MNWMEQSISQTTQMLKDLEGLIAIPSVREEAQKNAPFGTECRKALDYMMDLGRRGTGYRRLCLCAVLRRRNREHRCFRTFGCRTAGKRMDQGTVCAYDKGQCIVRTRDSG